MIIGLTGSFCGGKDTVANYLVEKKGYIHYSLSDVIRNKLKKRKKKITRQNLQNFGNELREKHGPTILAERIIAKLEKDKNYVVSSIRNPAEVGIFRTRKDFVLVNVDAPIKMRFERMKQRDRGEKDPQTYEQFLENERFESSENTAGLQLHKVAKMAKIVLMNNSTQENLYRKIDKMLKDITLKYVRPSWDEYFMQIVRAVSARGTCDRGRTAAVIVKDKRILATGYVGSPIGLPHCDEVGHQMKAVKHEDGTVSKHCLRTNHGELNAVALAARNGVKIDGATIYTKFEPCYTCAKMLINAGIKRVVCEKRYHAAKDSREIFKQAGVNLEVLYDELEKYEEQ